MVNLSVERFRRLTEDLKAEVHESAVSELLIQATELAGKIQAVAPVGETGELRTSVRVVPGKTDTVVRIVAGNAKTVRDGYSYPRADEFGTIHMHARPFFFPTYRLLRKSIRSRMRSKIVAAIKKRSAE